MKKILIGLGFTILLTLILFLIVLPAYISHVSGNYLWAICYIPFVALMAYAIGNDVLKDTKS